MFTCFFKFSVYVMYVYFNITKLIISSFDKRMESILFYQGASLVTL